MNFTKCTDYAKEKKLSEQFVDFVDLTDEALEEINISDCGHIQGGSCGSCGFGSCCASILFTAPGFFSGSCSCDFGSCGFGSCGFGSCGSCGFGICN